MHDGIVLVVDDDPLVRNLAVVQLKRGGIKAEAASSVREALERCTRGDIHLVVTDVKLAHPKEGLELVDRLHGLDPELPIVFLTGYPGSTSEYTYIDVIHKPHTERELVLAVRGKLLAHCTNQRVRSMHDMLKLHIDDKQAHHPPSLTAGFVNDVKSPTVRFLLGVVGTLLLACGAVGLALLKGLMK